MLLRRLLLNRRNASPETDITFPASLHEGDNGEWGKKVYNAIVREQDGSVIVTTYYGSLIHFTAIYQVENIIEFYGWKWIAQNPEEPAPMYAILQDDGYFALIY